MMAYRRWFAIGFVLLVAACSSPATTMTPTATLAPMDTFTPSPVPPTLPPGVTPTITLAPSLTLTPSVTLTSSLTPTNTPFQVTGSGALALRLPDTSAETITALEFSPDATTLLVTLNDGLNPHVGRLTWDTSGAHFVRLSDLALDQAVYSPDGSQTAFAQRLYSPNSRQDANGNPAIVFAGLIVGDGNGGNRQNVTPSDGSFSPSWSPDGRQLAYFRPAPDNATPECANDLPGSCFSLVLYDVAKQTSSVDLTMPYLAGEPLWSPDGRKLLLQQTGEGGGSAAGVVDLTACTPPDCKFRLLIPDPNAPDSAVGFTGAVWEPDSQAVIYSGLNGGLWTEPIQGGTPTPLISEQITNVSNPYWPPNSPWLYYLSNTVAVDGSTTQQVWRVDPSHPKPVLVLPGALTCDRVAWSVAANILACSGPVNNQPAITLYALPSPL